MYYYKEDKLLYLQTADTKIYMDPDGLEIISPHGKNLFPIMSDNKTEFINTYPEDKELSTCLHFYHNIRIDLSTPERSTDSLYKDIKTFGYGDSPTIIILYPNAYFLTRHCMYLWFKDSFIKYVRAVQMLDPYMEKTRLNHLLIIQHLYDLRRDEF